jgi:predicted DNA-binding antitoxin AbrB/MazE fold protein
MTKTLRAVFDGAVLRPEEPVDLKPNTRYVVTIEREEDGVETDRVGDYPLTQIGRLATDMGVTDLSIRHSWYAHGRLEDNETDDHFRQAGFRALLLEDMFEGNGI